MMENKIGFLKNHADTIAIIGVNIALAAILVSMWVSNTHRVDAANARTDTIICLIHQEFKDFHGRLISLEERMKK